jgi:hypothetical protein
MSPAPAAERIERRTKTDFDVVVTHLPDFWDHDRAARVHPPMLVHEFGDTAFVVREGGDPIA